MAYALHMIRWETAVSGSSDQWCHSQNFSYPIWTPLISAPASQAPDRLHSSLLAYFSQVCHVRLHKILSWPHFPTIPNTPCLFRLNTPLPCIVAAMRKGPSLHVDMLHFCAFLRGGGCWGIHFNEFTAVLPGPVWGVGWVCSAWVVRGETAPWAPCAPILCPTDLESWPWAPCAHRALGITPVKGNSAFWQPWESPPLHLHLSHPQSSLRSSCHTWGCYNRTKLSSPCTARSICAALTESVFCHGNSSIDSHLPSKREAHRLFGNHSLPK